jgi:hypothetical protein
MARCRMGNPGRVSGFEPPASTFLIMSADVKSWQVSGFRALCYAYIPYFGIQYATNQAVK